MRSLADSPQKIRKIYLFAGMISIALSCWVSMHQGIINPDAICYLLGADKVGQSGVHAAMQLCGQASWPFYSALIYVFSKLSFLSLTASAYFLDGLFTLVSVLTFIAIVQALGGNRRVLMLAAFVILSAHQFNAVREYIIRDHGFWAFYLLSLLFLLRYLRDARLVNALGFGVSMMIAVLFRIEGAVFLAVLPFLVFLNGGTLRKRIAGFLQLNIVALAALVVGGLWLAMHPQESVEKMGRVPELINQMTNGLLIAAQHFQATKSALVQFVLPHEAARDAGMVWAAALFVLFFLNIISNLSFAATALIIYAWVAGVGANFSRAGKLVLWGYLLINTMIGALFFVERLFFSKRYLIAMTLVLLLWVPFALDHLLRDRSEKRLRYAAFFVMGVFFASSFGVVMNTGTSKIFVRDAGNWLASNLPHDAKLYSNDLQLAYYSRHYGDKIYSEMGVNRNVDAALQHHLQEYDYAALRSNIKDQRVAEWMRMQHARVIKEFRNKHGDNVVIYQVPRVAVQ